MTLRENLVRIPGHVCPKLDRVPLLLPIARRTVRRTENDLVRARIRLHCASQTAGGSR